MQLCFRIKQQMWLPPTIESGPWIIILVTEGSANIILFTTPKMATDVESPILATAIIKVGIPLATPYPFERNLNKQGTTTAGATAATIVPEII